MSREFRRYRIYFNSREASPACWSIDEGDASTERQVVAFNFNSGVYADSHTLDPKTRASADPKTTPFAWIEVIAVMDIYRPPNGAGDVAEFWGS